MMRKLDGTHETAAMEVAQSTGLFDDDQMTLLRQMFKQGLVHDGHSPFWLGACDATVSGVIYCEPERMTHGTWNLQLIAVRPGNQKQGIGSRMLAEVEAVVRGYAARLLLVDTAGIEEFEHVRTFYKKHGFSEEARVRGFYADGVDRVTFAKRL